MMVVLNLFRPRYSLIAQRLLVVLAGGLQRRLRALLGVYRKRRELLFQSLALALGTRCLRRSRRTDQHFELVSALLAFVFVDRHLPLRRLSGFSSCHAVRRFAAASLPVRQGLCPAA